MDCNSKKGIVLMIYVHFFYSIIDIEDKKAIPCFRIVLMASIKGYLDVSREFIHFKAASNDSKDAFFNALLDRNFLQPESSWPVSRLVNCLPRRYCLEDTAIELFFNDGTNW